MSHQALSPTSKRIIISAVFVGALLLLYSVRSIVPPFILAAVVAYVLNPLVERLVRLTRRSRRSIVALIYIILIIGLTIVIIALVPALLRQIRAINIDMEAIAGQIRRLLADYQHIEIAGFSFDLVALSGEIRGAIQSIASFLATHTGGIVVDVISGLAWLIIALLVSFHLLTDADSIQSSISGALPSAYQPDANNLFAQINAVLSDYLRGQLVLALVVGVVTGVALALVGVRNALLLGVIAGALEVVPTIGPILASIPAIAIALFQGSTHLPMENYWFALLVAGLYIIIQQVENNVLVPRIIGASVSLHPVVVIFAALAGASLAGLLGIFLAIPVIATARIIGAYVFQKLREQ